jgi:hypothetical protein
MMINQYQILKQLDFERVGGTEGEQRGSKIITDTLSLADVPYEIEEFDLHSFDHGTGQIRIGDLVVDCVPFGLTESNEVTGKLVVAENLDLLNYNPGRFDDAVVIYVHGILRPYDILKQNKVKALIRVTAPRKKVSTTTHRQNAYTENKLCPCVTISYDDAKHVWPHNGREVTLSIKQTVSQTVSRNIVVKLDGTDPDLNMTYLVGHYDTVPRSPGAMDNGGGTVNLLGLAEHFYHNRPRRDLTIVFFSSEEMGLLGSVAYTQRHEECIVERARLVINIDMAGEYIGQNQMVILGTRELMGYSASLLREEGYLFNERLDIYSSDCMPFARLEVPSVNLYRTGGEAIHDGHTEDDRYTNTCSEGLMQTMQAGRIVLERVLNAEIYPVKREIDDSLREKIEKYYWNLTLEKPELKWREKYTR